VNPDAIGANDGTSWSDGFVSLDDALDPSSNTALLQVNPGTLELRLMGRHAYIPNGTTRWPSNTADPRHATFHLHPNVHIVSGGWSGLEAVGVNTGQGLPTLLSGDRGAPDDPSDNCYHVLMPTVSSAGVPQYLKNVSVVYGIADGPASDDQYGGGVYVLGSRLHMLEVEVRDCHAVYGGGLAIHEHEVLVPVPRIHESSLFARRCLFRSCTAKLEGGGVHFRQSGPIQMMNCIIRHNSSSLGGGLLLGSRIHDCVIINPLIHDNVAVEYGGGVYAYDTECSQAPCGYFLVNGTIAYNQTASGVGFGTFNARRGAGVFVEHDTGAAPAMSRAFANTIVYANPGVVNPANDDNLAIEVPPGVGTSPTLDVSNCFLGASFTDTGIALSSTALLTTNRWGISAYIDAQSTGNVPGWINPSARNFRLLSTARCIDQGTDQAIFVDFLDLDGDDLYFMSPLGSELTPRELFMGDEANQTGATSTREVLVPGLVLAPPSIGVDAGQVAGQICDIGAYEYRIVQ